MKLARIAALLIALPSLVLAQQKVVQHRMAGGLPSSLRFELPEGAEEVSIPFRTINNHLILDVTVNGEGPFPIILDTGCRRRICCCTATSGWRRCVFTISTTSR